MKPLWYGADRGLWILRDEWSQESPLFFPPTQEIEVPKQELSPSWMFNSPVCYDLDKDPGVAEWAVWYLPVQRNDAMSALLAEVPIVRFRHQLRDGFGRWHRRVYEWKPDVVRYKKWLRRFMREVGKQKARHAEVMLGAHEEEEID